MTHQEKAEAYVKEKPIFGGKYKIYTDGSIFSEKTARLLKCYLTPDGYVQADLYDENNKKCRCLVHRLVAEAFLDNPENKPQVNHKNSIRSDNNLENLEWATVSENTIHNWSVGGRSETKSSSGERFIYKLGNEYQLRATYRFKTLEEAVVARDAILEVLRKIA